MMYYKVAFIVFDLQHFILLVLIKSWDQKHTPSVLLIIKSWRTIVCLAIAMPKRLQCG